MAGFKPFSKQKAIREESRSKPCLRACAARTPLHGGIPLRAPRGAVRARGAAGREPGRATKPFWSQRRPSSALLLQRSHLMVLLGSPQPACLLKCTITTFKRRRGGCCCLGAPIAHPAAAGHAILLDRFMRALCEPTRCRPSTAPSWLINQRHPAKTCGVALSRDRDCWAGLCRGPLAPWSSTQSTHLSPAGARTQWDAQGCPAPGVLALRATPGHPQPSRPSQGRATPLPFGIVPR